MTAEYVQVTRQLKLEATGGADSATIPLEIGTPYRHLIVWAKADGGTINVNVQPVYMGVNEGSATNLTTNAPTSAFQSSVDEIRPATRPEAIRKHPNDESKAFTPTFEVVVTNAAAAPVTVNLYMLAAATPGAT